MIRVDQLPRECVIVTQEEYDRLMERQRERANAQMKVLMAKLELRRKIAWGEIT